MVSQSGKQERQRRRREGRVETGGFVEVMVTVLIGTLLQVHVRCGARGSGDGGEGHACISIFSSPPQLF